MDKERNPSRRQIRAAFYSKKVVRDPHQKHIFTDAAKRGPMCGIAYTNLKEDECSMHTSCTTPEEAEMLAIALAIGQTTTPTTLTNIYTDSKKACHLLASGITFPSALQLLATGRGQARIHWVPGHMGLAGNERANQLAREALIRAPADHVCTLKSHPQRRIKMRQYLHERMEYPPPHPLLDREEQTLLRQAQTNTLQTPAWLHRLRHGTTSPPPQCSHCNATLNQEHILWECTNTSALRTHHTKEWLATACNHQDQRDLVAFIRSATSSCLDGGG